MFAPRVLRRLPEVPTDDDTVGAHPASLSL